jgi:hypothetical protein
MNYRCTRCILPDTWPGIHYDDEGVCNLCRGYERRWGRWLADERIRAGTKQKLDQIIESVRKRNKGNEYDVLVPISGGKDSLYVLWYLKNTYDLNILCYTYDNGMFADVACENMRLATEKTGFPHIFESHPFQHDLMRHFFLKTGNPCGACVMPYIFGALCCARRHDIPLIMFGLSTRLDANLPEGMNPFYFEKVIKDGYNGESLDALRQETSTWDYAINTVTRRRRSLNLPDYIEWDTDFIAKLLAKEWGVTLGEEHADCVAHETADWSATRRYGFGFAPIVLSQQIRSGIMTREGALSRLPEREQLSLPESFRLMAERLGITEADALAASERDESVYFRGPMNFLARHYRNLLLGRSRFSHRWFMPF